VPSNLILPALTQSVENEIGVMENRTQKFCSIPLLYLPAF